jgi:hypothetical protein
MVGSSVAKSRSSATTSAWVSRFIRVDLSGVGVAHQGRHRPMLPQPPLPLDRPVLSRTSARSRSSQQYVTERSTLNTYAGLARLQTADRKGGGQRVTIAEGEVVVWRRSRAEALVCASARASGIRGPARLGAVSRRRRGPAYWGGRFHVGEVGGARAARAAKLRARGSRESNT